jgi:signal peptidase I
MPDMEIPMDTPTTAPQQRSRFGTATAIGAWVLMVAAALFVLALLASTVGPRFLPYQALVVRSGSMSPTIPTGSIVFYTEREAKDVMVGDVIVFAKPGEPNEKVTHRVFQIGNSSTGRYFVTKGDANGTTDDWRVPAVGSGWVESFHVPYAGYILADMQSDAGRLLLLLIPAVLLGAITLGELWHERRRGAPA